jgi:hypothetical protein
MTKRKKKPHWLKSTLIQAMKETATSGKQFCKECEQGASQFCRELTNTTKKKGKE